MKIVIDIPETFYKDCKECCELKWGGYYTSRLMNAIKNSTPLPEHHGRIIDESQISRIEIHTERELYGDKIRYVKVTDAPTIIEGSENV